MSEADYSKNSYSNYKGHNKSEYRDSWSDPNWGMNEFNNFETFDHPRKKHKSHKKKENYDNFGDWKDF